MSGRLRINMLGLTCLEVKFFDKFMEQLWNRSGDVFESLRLLSLIRPDILTYGRCISAHSLYPRFFEFGDAESYLKGLERIREEFKSDDEQLKK